MLVDIQDAEAVAEIEELTARFELPVETVIERLIIDAGCWMPIETLANPYWEDRVRSNLIPSWHRHVKYLPIFAKDWDLKMISYPPGFELTHRSGFKVTLSVYDPESMLWGKAPGLIHHMREFRRGPSTRLPIDWNKTPSQRNTLIKQARRIAAEIDPLRVLVGLEREIIRRYMNANPVPTE